MIVNRLWAPILDNARKESLLQIVGNGGGGTKGYAPTRSEKVVDKIFGSLRYQNIHRLLRGACGSIEVFKSVICLLLGIAKNPISATAFR